MSNSNPPLRLFYSPGACSLAAHVALEESGLSYTTTRIDVRGGENLKLEYLRINPLGKVPALEVSGEILTEGAAILAYVADQVQRLGLLPEPGSFARARAQEWLNFLASTVHVAYRAIFRPERIAGSDPGTINMVRQVGGRAVAEAMLEIERRIDGTPFVLGNTYSLCDAYAYVFWRWSQREAAAPFVPALPKLASLAERVEARPAVKAVLRREMS
jgi:glutathione S-transferase